jgi:hypothetical protein
VFSLASKSDESISRFYDSAYRSAIIQMIAIGLCFGIAIVVVLWTEFGGSVKRLYREWNWRKQ